jgi:O-acetyl-ADP-ribose deacetylase (regulator of RNase III)
LVNTVNTVGVMGKGIALMFRERFDPNFRLYQQACKAGAVQTGRMFVTETGEFEGPRWVINFPTKQDWRGKSRMEWIDAGLADLVRVIRELGIRSIAIPPLGAGNGGLRWSEVKPRIEAALSELPEVDVIVYEPSEKYQNVAKTKGAERLTSTRALVAELVRRYLVLGVQCSKLEIHKLAWFLERVLNRQNVEHDVALQFEANRYGPYAHKLEKVLDGLDGSYLRCDKRIADAKSSDLIWFDDARRDRVQAYLHSEAKRFLPVLDEISNLIDGFDSPVGMELLATVDWLLHKMAVAPTVEAVRAGLLHWPKEGAGERKNRLFSDRQLELAIAHLRQSPLYAAH